MSNSGEIHLSVINAVRLTGGDRALADDLVQEACLALARQMQATPAAELGTGWLVVVLRRRYLDHVRRRRRERLRLERDTAPCLLMM